VPTAAHAEPVHCSMPTLVSLLELSLHPGSISEPETAVARRLPGASGR